MIAGIFQVVMQSGKDRGDLDIHPDAAEWVKARSMDQNRLGLDWIGLIRICSRSGAYSAR